VVFVAAQGAAAPVKTNEAPQPASGPTQASAPAASPEPLALAPLPAFDDRPGAFHVYGVTYDGAAGRLVVHASQPFTYALAQWQYPDRLAIDISGGVFLERRKDVEVGAPSIRNIVVSQLDLSPNVTRILVHLTQKIPYVTASTDRGRTLAVTFLDAGARIQAPPASGALGPRAPVVVIDPGHGGDDPGAIGAGGLREADVTLAIGRLTRDALQRQGVHVILTRTDDSSVALEDRPDFAQRAGATVFVSIHANASGNRNAQGTTTYFYSPQSQALAAAIQQEVVAALGEPDRGVQTARFYVIVNATMPAVLIEIAFISNAKEEAMLRDPAVQQRIAAAIARGIEAYLGQQAQVAPH
jgi:N-acetylmuramoyl-L-alanine amidase